MSKTTQIAESLNTMAESVRPFLEDDANKLEDLADELNAIEEEKHPWSNDTRPAPQVHFRVNVSGLKRVPDATFTMDGDIRDIDMDNFFELQDRFQAEVDARYPLPSEESK